MNRLRQSQIDLWTEVETVNRQRQRQIEEESKLSKFTFFCKKEKSKINYSIKYHPHKFVLT